MVANVKISDFKPLKPTSKLRKIETKDSNIIESEDLLDSCKKSLFCEGEETSNEIPNDCHYYSPLQSNQITKDLTDSITNDLYALTKISPLVNKNKFRQAKTNKNKESILNKYFDSIENENCTLEPEDRTNVNAEKVIKMHKQINIKTSKEILKNVNHIIENNTNKNENPLSDIEQSVSRLQKKKLQNKLSTMDINCEVIDQNTSSNTNETPSIGLEETLSNENLSTAFHIKIISENPLYTKQSSSRPNDNFSKDDDIFNSLRGASDKPHTDTQLMFSQVENLNCKNKDPRIIKSSSETSEKFHKETLKEILHDNPQESSTGFKLNKDKCDSLRENTKKRTKFNMRINLSRKRKTKIINESRIKRVYSKPTSSGSDEENVDKNLVLSDSSTDLEVNQKPQHVKKGFRLFNSEKKGNCSFDSFNNTIDMESRNNETKQVPADTLSNKKPKQKYNHESSIKISTANPRSHMVSSKSSNKTNQLQEEQKKSETNMDEQDLLTDEVNITKKTSNKTKTRKKPYSSNDAQYKQIIKQNHILGSIKKIVRKENEDLLGFKVERQCSLSQKSKNKDHSIWTSTPIVQEKCGIDQRKEACKHLPSNSSLSTSIGSHEKFKGSSRESQSVLQTLNDSKDEIQSTFMCSDDELEVLEGLNIYIDWELPKLHTIGSESPNKSVAKLKKQLCYEDGEITLQPYTEYEEEKIKRNWEKFSKIYRFRNTDLFVSPDKFNKHFSKSNRLKFQQFLARGLPNRRLHSVYAKFRQFFIATPTRWTPVEDKLLLEIHRLYNNPDDYGAVRNIMLPKIFNRSALAISQRLSSFLKEKMVRDYIKMTVDWTSELEGTLIHYLLESCGVGTVEDLRSSALPYEIWKHVALQLDLPFCQVVDHWRYNLYPRLFSRSSVMCPALYVQLIRWIHDADIKEWKEIDWEELSNRMEGVGPYFLCKCLRMLILNYVPYKRHQIFRACIRFLYLYRVPDFMAVKSQHVLKRVHYNPETKVVEEIKDLAGSSDEEDSENN